MPKFYITHLSVQLRRIVARCLLNSAITIGGLRPAPGVGQALEGGGLRRMPLDADLGAVGNALAGVPFLESLPYRVPCCRLS